ncbi:hypothetical protein HHJ78_04375 [Mobiluncus mulieris]|uniref:Uncharacterized protein n=1 Tax=Mobiluncus mulieris TaxID=2052 RepID=A0A7Y0U0Y2_9ACTO|nr:hypothetical protein [Mobiluncus mulieris]NMW64782.1 hypothetical protein [Mobiluncus mulieris]
MVKSNVIVKIDGNTVSQTKGDTPFLVDSLQLDWGTSSLFQNPDPARLSLKLLAPRKQLLHQMIPKIGTDVELWASGENEDTKPELPLSLFSYRKEGNVDLDGNTIIYSGRGQMGLNSRRSTPDKIPLLEKGQKWSISLDIETPGRSQIDMEAFYNGPKPQYRFGIESFWPAESPDERVKKHLDWQITPQRSGMLFIQIRAILPRSTDTARITVQIFPPESTQKQHGTPVFGGSVVSCHAARRGDNHLITVTCVDRLAAYDSLKIDKHYPDEYDGSNSASWALSAAEQYQEIARNAKMEPPLEIPTENGVQIPTPLSKLGVPRFKGRIRATALELFTKLANGTGYIFVQQYRDGSWDKTAVIYRYGRRETINLPTKAFTATIQAAQEAESVYSDLYLDTYNNGNGSALSDRDSKTRKAIKITSGLGFYNDVHPLMNNIWSYINPGIATVKGVCLLSGALDAADAPQLSKLLDINQRQFLAISFQGAFGQDCYRVNMDLTVTGGSYKYRRGEWELNLLVMPIPAAALV